MAQLAWKDSDLTAVRKQILIAAREILKDDRAYEILERRLTHADTTNAYHEIAKDWGVTRERIRQLQGDAFRRIAYDTTSPAGKRLRKMLRALIRPDARGYQQRLFRLSGALLPHSRPSSSIWYVGHLAGIEKTMEIRRAILAR